MEKPPFFENELHKAEYEKSQQMTLWEEPTMPVEYLAYFRQTGLCQHCHWPLRHHMHAYNHWKRHHRPRVKVQRQGKRAVEYRVWVKEQQVWVKASMYQAIAAIGQCRPIMTIYAKEVTHERLN